MTIFCTKMIVKIKSQENYADVHYTGKKKSILAKETNKTLMNYKFKTSEK